MMVVAVLLAGLQGANLDAEAGYQGSVFPGGWTRVSAVLTYEGTPLEAELRITLRGPLLEPVLYRRSVPLSRKSRMRLGTDVFLSGGETDAVVELVAEGKSLGQKVVPLRVLQESGHRLLAVGTLPDYLTDGLAGNPSVRVVRTSPDLLPPSVLALRCLDTIVIPSALQLDPGQEDALAAWVAQGGRLIFGAGPSTQLGQNPFWRSRCPMADPQLSTLRVRVNDKDVPVGLVRGTLLRGRELLPLGGAPAAVRVSEGWGQVVFLAVLPDQPDLEQVLPGSAVVAELLELSSRREVELTPSGKPKALRAHDVTDALRKMILDIGSVRAGAAGVGIAAGVVYVLLIGPFEYVRLRKKGRLRKGWISFGAIVILWSGLVLGWGGAFSPRPSRLVHLTLWDEGRIQTFAVLHSPAGRTYAAEASGGLAPLAPTMFFGTPEPSQPITVDLPAHVRFDAPPSSLRCLVGAPPVEAGSASVTSEWLGSGKRKLSVHNATSVTLKECWIVSKDTVWPAGEIPALTDGELALEGGETFAAWSRKIRAPVETILWTRSPPVWDRVAPEKFGLVLSFFDALHSAWNENDEIEFMRDRGFDRSSALARGDTVLVGSFSQNLSGFRIDPGVEAATFGWARILVREAKR